MVQGTEINMEKAYQPREVEEKIYQLWEKSKAFTPKIDPKIKPFTIVIPPPNITGSLHMGHALNNTIQDIIIRYYRMQGQSTLWLPGTDHAGIATQNVVEKKLRKEGKTRHDLGRENFIEQVWQWKKEYGDLILKQLRKLGASCDWSRTRFTLDEQYSKAVKKAFVNYYNKGYIYKGPRVVNWCPRCNTAISDIEIKYQPQTTKLYTFKYEKKFPITIATTRPETKLGDTAIAVNPQDIRYKKYIGQEFPVNFLGLSLKIKVIADRKVDPEFGTGALGVTPAHSLIDFEMAQKNDLDIKNVIDENGRMNNNAGVYAGLKVEEARQQIVAELEKQNLLEKTENYEHSLSLCDRCNTPIEPLISNQWFVKMDQLAQPAIKVVKEDKIKFYPKRYKKIYLDWMENLRDWCISRQLWWGHQLPVYYCQNCDAQHLHPIIADESPTECPECHAKNIVQDPDVLDTWFSSALWPFATLGWPEQTEDLKYFYPTNFLCTAPEILYLWVARMIFSSLEFTNQIPFSEIYLHSTILTKDGQRMSKSKPETIVDPLEMIETYGADATRFGIVYQTTRDLQAIRFSKDDLLAGQRFINKLWNMGRFIKMLQAEKKQIDKSIKIKSLADKWIVNQLNKTIQQVDKLINEYEFGKATHILYDFSWYQLADWYIEIAKTEKNLSLLENIYLTLLKLLHPFIPFATEEIYSQFNKQKNQLLMISDWPNFNKKLIDKKNEQNFEFIKNLIIKIRNIKKENKMNTGEIITAYVLKTESNYFDLIKKQKKIIECLSRVKIKFVDKKLKEGVKIIINKITINIK
ncbi:MAG: valine--tRNA ligase [Patescibacteria group bacterium]|nr:valine--tRNA ligase [Patescibacteria group bacterium]